MQNTNSKTSVRLIALDMDGTLLRQDKTIHPDTVRDIEDAVRAGIHVVYSSGRSVDELGPYVKTLSPMRYAVCMSGALVYDFAENRSIYKKAIPQEYVREIAAEAKRADGMLHLLTEHAAIVRADQVTHMADYQMGVFQQTYQQVCVLASDMEAEIQKRDAIEKVNIYYRSEEDRFRGCDALKHLPLTFAFADRTSLEINAAGVTKAAGLSVLTAYLCISMQETMGIGDQENDRAMLEAVGCSVAMGNAVPAIKEICDYITADNEHNGVGEAIRKLCL